MTPPSLPEPFAVRLTPAQQQWLTKRLPQSELIEDLSWDIIDTSVLHVRSAGHDVIVKAGGPQNHHLRREIAAHDGYTAVLAEAGLGARAVHIGHEENIVVLEYLPGDLVEGGDAEFSPDVHRQAGAALALFHRQVPPTQDEEADRHRTERALYWLDRKHRIPAAEEQTVRRILGSHRHRPAPLVPTHGDWQPRNWLLSQGIVHVIDFGRFALRTAGSDFCRLHAQQWRTAPALEQAFFEGYGEDPREQEHWRMELLWEAVGTAVYAYEIGDESFEVQGQRTLREALELF